MTQHLRKLIMSLAVSAFLFGALSVQTNAQELYKVWERSALTGATEGLPSWYTVGYIRGMDIYGDNLYAADRTNSLIRVMNTETGADVTLATPYDLTGVAGGTYAMNDLAFSDDGALFLGSLSTNTSSPTDAFRLYWWTSEGGTYSDSLNFSTTAAHRIGDKISVVGSLADNTIEVWMPAAGTTPGIIYVATTANQGADWSIETITLSGDQTAIGTNADVVPFGIGRTSDFYVAGNSSAPARYDNTGAYVVGSQLTSSSRNGLDLFDADGKTYLSVYTFRPEGVNSGNKTGMISIFDVTTASTPTLAFQTPLLGDDADTFSSIYGEGKVKVNNDGSFNLYTLEGVNGFAAFTNTVPPYYGAPTDKVFFSEYVEGSSSNKGLELFNNTDSTVTLANYQIAQASNGSEWKYFNGFAEGATIASGGVYTMIDEKFKPELFDFENADEVLAFPSPMGFNGDDARALIHIDPVTNDTTWIDMIGEELIRPDGGWAVAGVTKATADHTLIRKPSVTKGNPNPLGSFGTNPSNSEWIVKPMDFFDNLGKPSADLFAPLAGDYYVPKRAEDTQGFSSLYEALYSVSQSGLSAATTLFITADITDTVGVSISRSDLTESTPLTIKPAPGVTPTLDVISNGGDGIAIIRADYVTIDGSNTDGGTTRDLTITSSDNSLTNMVWIKETLNTTIKNTKFTYTGTKLVNGITPNESGAAGSVGWLIENNQIGSEAGMIRTGIGLWGFGAYTLDGSKIIGNDIITNHRGITSYLDSNSSVIGNTITIINPRENQAWIGGIYFAAASGTTNIIGNTIKGLQVNRTATAAYSGGILLNSNIGEVNVFNNVIDATEFANAGAATGNRVYGIGINNAGGEAVNHIYHNTIRVGSSDETGVHAAFGMATVTSSTQTWDVKNNIFVVDQDAENASAIHWPLAAEATSTLEANYNNYYLSGATANIGFYGEVGGDLAAWQTASGQDANTTTVEVDFVSATDYHLGLSDGDANLAGTPLASVTEDFDGTTRSTTAPYKGAYEGSIAVSNEINEVSEEPLTFSLSQNYPNPFNPTSNIRFTLPQTNNVRLDVYNINGQLVQTLVNTRMNAGEHTVQFNAGNLASGVYIYRIISGNFVQSKKMTLIK